MIKKRIFSALLAVTLSANLIALPAGAEDNSPDFMTDAEIESMIPIIENIDDYMISFSECNSSISELKASTCTDYGYKDMELRENTEGRQQFYNDIATKAESFWNNRQDISAVTNQNVGDIYVMGMCVIDDYGITFDEAASVYDTFRSDNPILYYLSNMFLGFVQDDKTYVIIASFEDFAKSSVRRGYAQTIPDFIESYSSCVSGESLYEDAKAIHDKIITTMDFAYEEDGVTASETGIAHSIIGAIEGEGVCESYARAYQLLCTYYGINNIFVKGNSHAWNIIQLDDGLYYNVDCTWDDSGDTPVYKYFAAGTDSFYKTHTPCTPDGTGIYFQYELPEISQSDYQSPEISETTTTTTTTDTTTTTTDTTTTTTDTTTTTTDTTTTTTDTTTTTVTTSTTKPETTTTTSEATTITTETTTTKPETKPTTTTTTTITTTTTTSMTVSPQLVKGDINYDGIFNIADVVILQKYLLCEIDLDNSENADFYSDNIINTFDLCFMKSALLKK